MSTLYELKSGDVGTYGDLRREDYFLKLNRLGIPKAAQFLTYLQTMYPEQANYFSLMKLDTVKENLMSPDATLKKKEDALKVVADLAYTVEHEVPLQEFSKFERIINRMLK